MADMQLDPQYGSDASEEIEQISQEAGDEAGTTGEGLQDLDQLPQFRKWKSTMDKKLAEKEAELARYRGQVAAESPDTLAQQRSQLFNQWQQVSQAAAEAEEEDDRETLVAASAQAARLADRLFDMDVRIAATKRGINPNDPELRKVLMEAYENGEIQGPKDIDYLMLTYNERKPQGNGSAMLKATDVDEIVSKLRKELELELRAKMGLTVPGVSPGPSPASRAKIEKDMALAKQHGDMVTYLGLKRQLTNLEE